MENKELNMVFPSNSPAKKFPNNTSSNFTLPLPYLMETPLEEHWKIGIVQLFLPLTFYNIESNFKIIVFLHNGVMKTINMMEGIYVDPLVLEKMILKKQKESSDFKISWKNGFSVTLSENTEKIVLSKKLSHILGLPFEINKSTFSSVKQFDPWVNQKVILIHCSLLYETQVNQQSYKILQSVITNKINFGDTFFKYFLPIDFKEIQGDVHKTISFKITDIEGELLKFRSGSVVLLCSFSKNLKNGT